jgi:hypothetical protein
VAFVAATPTSGARRRMKGMNGYFEIRPQRK